MQKKTGGIGKAYTSSGKTNVLFLNFYQIEYAIQIHLQEPNTFGIKHAQIIKCIFFWNYSSLYAQMKPIAKRLVINSRNN